MVRALFLFCEIAYYLGVKLLMQVRELRRALRRVDGDLYVLIPSGPNYRLPDRVREEVVVRLADDHTYRIADKAVQDFDELTTLDKTPLLIKAFIIE